MAARKKPSWRPAKSLDTLRGQINALAPNRNKAADGTVGDVAHSAVKSDHNPNAAGVVLALDITHDPAGGCNCDLLAQSLVDSRDPRIQYIIWKRRIINREVRPWVWRPYGGANPHDHHMHLSVDEDPAVYDDATPWWFRIAAGPIAAPTEAPTEAPPVKPTQPSPKPALPLMTPHPPEPAPKTAPRTGLMAVGISGVSVGTALVAVSADDAPAEGDTNIGLALGIGFLLVAAVAVWFVAKRWRK